MPEVVNLPTAQGDCTGPIVTWGGPLVCNLQDQYICDNTYNPECRDGGFCRGEDGHLRRDMDGDQDGQCDSDGDVDDDNDGVPDECDPHPNSQDLIQETIDYVRYYAIRGSHC